MMNVFTRRRREEDGDVKSDCRREWLQSIHDALVPVRRGGSYHRICRGTNARVGIEDEDQGIRHGRI